MKDENVEQLLNKIWVIRGALRGIGALLQQQTASPCYEGDELFGLGLAMTHFSEDLIEVEDSLRSKFRSL